MLRRVPGRHARRKRRQEVVAKACPGAGACGGMYTANTMASAIEAMGMSLPYSSSIPAVDPAQARRMLSGRRRHSRLLGKGHQAPRHHDPCRLRERDGAGDGPGRIDQRRAAPDRHGPGGRRAAHDRRLPEGQRPHSVSGRSQAQRQVRAGRPAQRRRHARGHEVPARKRPAQRRLPDRHRQDRGRKPARPAGAQGRSGRCAFVGRPDQAHGPHPDLARQPGARRCRGQDHRQGRRTLQRSGQSLRLRGRHAARAGAQGNRQGRRGDHSLRRPQGRARHAGNAHSDLVPSWAPAWARTWP